MTTLWIAVFVPALVQFALFLRWLHRRVRDDEIQRAFVRDLACSHLPHLYNALRHIADEMGIQNFRPAAAALHRSFAHRQQRLNSARQHLVAPMPITTPTRTDLIALARVTAAAHQLDAAMSARFASRNPHGIHGPSATSRHSSRITSHLTSDAGKYPSPKRSPRIFLGTDASDGQVAREHNFGVGTSAIAAPLSQLCDAVTGLEIGCTVFAAKLFARTMTSAARSNSGTAAGNPSYAGQVLAQPSRIIRRVNARKHIRTE